MWYFDITNIDQEMLIKIMILIGKIEKQILKKPNHYRKTHIKESASIFSGVSLRIVRHHHYWERDKNYRKNYFKRCASIRWSS